MGIDPFDSGMVLHFDADILVYKPCCIFNDDTSERTKRLLIENIDKKIERMCQLAGVSKFRLFLTTKTNFRDFIVDDYKANRSDIERPLNLSFAKRYLVDKYKAEFKRGLEADDLLAIHQTDKTIIWSPDKDLRQVAGWHLDDTTEELLVVRELGELIDGKKIKFNGTKGLYYQALVGDGADNIIGCGIRLPKVYKSGKKKGQSYVARQGVGPKKALALLNSCKQEEQSFLEVVGVQYMNIHNKKWQLELEKQMNLLFMVRTLKDDLIKRWTVCGRSEYMCLETGNISREGDL